MCDIYQDQELHCAHERNAWWFGVIQVHCPIVAETHHGVANIAQLLKELSCVVAQCGKRMRESRHRAMHQAIVDGKYCQIIVMVHQMLQSK